MSVYFDPKRCTSTILTLLYIHVVRQAMVDIGQDPWIGPKLGSLLTQTDFDVLESNERYLDYSE